MAKYREKIGPKERRSERMSNLALLGQRNKVSTESAYDVDLSGSLTNWITLSSRKEGRGASDKLFHVTIDRNIR